MTTNYVRRDLPPVVTEYHIPAMIQAVAYLRGKDMSEQSSVQSVVKMYDALIAALEKQHT